MITMPDDEKTPKQMLDRHFELMNAELLGTVVSVLVNKSFESDIVDLVSAVGVVGFGTAAARHFFHIMRINHAEENRQYPHS